MNFNSHWHQKDKHSFLSPSQYAWIRYDNEKLIERFVNAQAAKLGTEMHAFASKAIELGIRQAATKKTLNLYVNDALGYRMTPEQVLYFSDNCFGTADAIGFRKNMLRIFDLRTGVGKASFDQLLVYAAIFCLEYNFKPFEIDYDLRIYQSDEAVLYDVDRDDLAADVAHIMDKIKTFDRMINEMRMEGQA